MYEINNQVHENTINFLYNAATTILPRANPALNILKSFYINKTREIARLENLHVPNKYYGPSAMCQKCSLPWGEGANQIGFYSNKPKKGRKNNFIMAKIKKCKSKNIKKHVVLKCTLCKQRTKHILTKVHAASVKKTEAKPVVETSTKLIAAEITPTKPIKPNRPQITVQSKKSSKAKQHKPAQKKSQTKTNQKDLLALAALLSAGRPTALSGENKLKHFLK